MRCLVYKVRIVGRGFEGGVGKVGNRGSYVRLRIEVY